MLCGDVTANYFPWAPFDLNQWSICDDIEKKKLIVIYFKYNMLGKLLITENIPMGVCKPFPYALAPGRYCFVSLFFAISRILIEKLAKGW